MSPESPRQSREPFRVSSAPLAVRYLVALVVSAIALALTVAMAPLLNRTIFIWFFGAVIIAARYCGFGPALMTALIGILGVDYFIVPPAGSFKLQEGDAVGTIVFAVLSFVISTMTSQMRDARAVAERHAADAERNAERNRLLAAASNTLEESLELDVVLDRLARVLTEQIADYAQVYLVEGDVVRRAAMSCTVPEAVDVLREVERLPPLPLDGGPTNDVIRTGKPLLVSRVEPAYFKSATTTEEHLSVVQRIGIRSMVLAPLSARGRTLGMLLFARIRDERPYTEDDQELATEVAHRAAVAVDSARSYAEAVRARMEAQQANQAKQHFLAAMSHELRTPLNAIAGYAELLEMGIHGTMSEQQREPIARIRRSQRHLQSLVEQVLSFAKTEAGKRELAQEPVPMAAVLAQSAEMIAPQVSAAGLTLDVAPCDPALCVRGDREAIEQILINLLGNAVKYTPAGGSVRLACVAEGDVVCVRVSDTGPGIPADKREAVFLPFTQLDQELSRRKAGVGLGLAISRDLARAMRGDVTVDSAPGAGASFVLRLPRA